MSEAYIADDKLTAALDRATGPLTVVTAEGKVLGYVTPARPTLGFLKVPFTDEEIERMVNDRDAPCVPAAEVEAKIRELKCSR
jgi:hypothetical protein